MKSRPYHWLAFLPPVGMLCGIPIANRAAPRVLGMPPLMAWMIGCVLLTSIVMGLIFALDNRRAS